MKEKNKTLVDGRYAFVDLVDIEKLKDMFEAFSESAGFTTGVVSYPQQELLFGTGWRDICVKFHRGCESSEKFCKKSNLDLTSGLKALKEINIHPCENGLVDGATPVIVEGVHIASLFTGQILFDEPDLEKFKKQAKEFGFDEAAYLKALKKVPVVTRQRFKRALEFLSKIAVNLAEQGLRELRLKQTRLSLEVNKERFDQLADESGTIVWEVNVDGLFTYLNSVIEQKTGYRPDELVGKKLFYDLHPEDGREELKEKALELMKNKDSFKDLETRMVTKDGGILWLTTKGIPILDCDGQLAGYWGTNIDINERKELESELAESLTLFRAVIDQSPIPMAITTLAGKMTYNTACEKLLNLHSSGSSERVTNLFELKRTWKEYDVNGNLITDDQIPIAKAMRGISTLGEEFRLVRDDGVEFWYMVNAAPVDNAKGERVAAFVAFPDISERKRSEQEKEKLREQLSRAQKMESIGQLAGGIAHDFNNKLTVILGEAEQVQDEMAQDNPFRVSVDNIYKAATQSADLTRQLLGFARKQTVAPEVLDLNKVVEGSLKMLQRIIGETISLIWKPAAGLECIYIDPSQVDQVLTNLSVNARDALAGRSDGLITYETKLIEFDDDYCANHHGSSPGMYVMLAVSDNGYGMDDEIKKKIFEPFFTTKKMGEGTGLGLATVDGIVHQNDGFIDVRSELGNGTTFEMYFPARTEEPKKTATKETKEPIIESGATILLVEDEEAILDITTSLLEKMGYKVLSALRPKEAIKIAGNYEEEIELLVTDVVMPEMNGRDLQKKISEIRPEIKCLYVSGYTADVIAHQGVLNENVNFLQKPFTGKTLKQKVKEILK